MLMQRTAGKMDRIKRWISRHLLFVFSVIVAAFIFFGVPQVTNLWQQWPFLIRQRIGFAGLLLLMTGLYLSSMLLFWKPQISEILSRRLPSLRVLITELFSVSAWTLNWLQKTADRFQNQASGASGIAAPALMVLVGGVMAAITPIDLHFLWLMSGCCIRMLGAWMVLVGLWLAYGKWIGIDIVLAASEEDLQSLQADATGRKSAAGENVSFQNVKWLVDRRSLWQIAGQVLSWIAAMTTAGELLWIAADWNLPGSSLRLYSIWMICHLCITLVMIAAWLDFANERSLWPVRAVAVVVLLLVLANHGSESILDPQAETFAVRPSAASETADDNAFLTALETRLNQIPEGPVVLVAASGGGSRAALFASLVIEMLHSERMPKTSSNPQLADSETVPSPMDPETDSAATPETGSKENATQKSSNWADHVLMISSVSGGSLATAKYASDPAETALKRVELRYTDRQELIQRTLAHLEELQTRANDTAHPSSKDLTAMDRAYLQTAVDAINWCDSEARKGSLMAGDDTMNAESATRSPLELSQTQPLSAAAGRAARIGFTSQFADLMAMDFMAPILRGFLTPFCSRGRALRVFWDRQLQWDRLMTDTSIQRPLVLINTTDIDAGRRVITGFPSIPAGFLQGSGRFAEDQPNADSVSLKTAPRGREYVPVSISDFCERPIFHVSPGQAVRLSSNFPWGFQIQEYSPQSSPSLMPAAPDQQPIVRGAADRSSFRFLDGGVVDNTGMDSLAAVFESLRLRAAGDPTGRESGILRRIRNRGVIILEIDSGAKSTPTGSELFGFGWMKMPMTALNNGVYLNAVQLGDSRLEQMSRQLTTTDSLIRANQLTVTKPGAVVTSRLEGEQTGDNVRTEQLRNQISALLTTPNLFEMDTTVRHFRFECNDLENTDADVMTAFALGPADKAVVVQMFVTEVQRWHQWAQAEVPALMKAVTPNPEALSKLSADFSYNLLKSAMQRLSDLRLNIMEAGADRYSPETVSRMLQGPAALLRTEHRLFASGSGTPPWGERRAEVYEVFLAFADTLGIAVSTDTDDYSFLAQTTPPEVPVAAAEPDMNVSVAVQQPLLDQIFNKAEQSFRQQTSPIVVIPSPDAPAPDRAPETSSVVAPSAEASAAQWPEPVLRDLTPLRERSAAKVRQDLQSLQRQQFYKGRR